MGRSKSAVVLYIFSERKTERIEKCYVTNCFEIITDLTLFLFLIGGIPMKL